MVAKNRSNEIRITRIYDAPKSAVWDAWTNPKKLAQWWGPRGFTITTHDQDLRIGGSWTYTMYGPDGVNYPNKTKYLEVEKYSRLIYDHGENDDHPALFRVNVLFSETHGKTKMEMSMILPTPEAVEETKKLIRKAGGDSTWDRLAEYLEKEISGKEKFVINRSFLAPIEKMFEVWIDPNENSRWLAPKGSHMAFISANIKPGGGAFYSMTNEAGAKMYGRTTYLDISRPNRIVYTQQFCDEKENITRHPLAPTWPENMLTTVTFTAEGPDQTRVTVEWEPHGPVTSEEMHTFITARAGMTQGWTGSFDQLDEYLSTG